MKEGECISTSETEMEERASMTIDLLSLPVNTSTRFVSPRARSSARRDPRVKVRRVRAPLR